MRRIVSIVAATALSAGFVVAAAGVAMAADEVAVQPKNAIFNEATYAAATEITFTAECKAGFNISWQQHAKADADPGDTGWFDVDPADTTDNTATANTLKVKKDAAPTSSAGRLYRAKCSNGSTTVYSKPAGFWYIGLKQENLGETSRSIWPLPTLELQDYQIYRVTEANKEVVLGLSMYFNELTVAETSPGKPDIRKLDLTKSKFNAWGNPCTVKWTNEKGEEVGKTADGGYRVTLSADEAKALNTKIIPTVSCEGSTVTQSVDPKVEWVKVAFATDFRYSETSTEYGLFADPKWACIPDEAFGPDGKSTEKIT